MKKELNYKIIDRLSKLYPKNIFMFFQYGLNNYANRIILVHKKYYMFNECGLKLIKNKRTINDLQLNCSNLIR